MSKKLTHIDPAGRPAMVDVGAKQVTRRVAIASATVHFPADVAATLHADGLRSAKGPVLDTAIIAGTMAVKRTHELIPFCHPLPIEKCRFEMEFVSATELVIRCEVGITHKTGVEMEALTGASVAVTADVNGDGTADLMIGAPGTGESAYVLFADPSWQPDNNIYGTVGDDAIEIPLFGPFWVRAVKGFG